MIISVTAKSGEGVITVSSLKEAQDIARRHVAKNEESLISNQQIYEDWSAVEAREARGVYREVAKLPHFCRTCRATKCDGGCEYKQLMTERDELEEQLHEALSSSCNMRGTCGI